MISNSPENKNICDFIPKTPINMPAPRVLTTVGSDNEVMILVMSFSEYRVKYPKTKPKIKAGINNQIAR